MDLTEPEIRVLGCLLEKQRTTPEAYPLSLNALRLACNQSTNREPLTDYDEPTIRDALHRLSRRRWARLASGPGSRATKYRHLLDEALGLPDDEVAVLCVLMLRGPQTPGELKQRTERLHAFRDREATQAALMRLVERGLAVCLARRPGQKEERFEHLLSGDRDEVAASSRASVAAVAGDDADDGDRATSDDLVARLQDDLAALRAEVGELRAALDVLRAELGA